MISGTIIFIFAVVIGSVSQVLLKQSALKMHDTVVKEYLNLSVMSAYALLFISFALTVAAYRTIELRLTPVFDSMSYLIVPLLGVIFFGDRIKKGQLYGLLLIIGGIVIFNIR